MKKLLMLFGVVTMIHTTGAFGDAPVRCFADYNCGDGTGGSGLYDISYPTVGSVGRIPANNTTCSKSGSQFSHWAVTMDNGTPSSPIAYPGELYDLYGCTIDNHLIFTAVFVSNGATTSKPYVDDQIATRQVKIPAANPSNTNIGDTVITYTNVAGGGVIGERQLYTGGSYSAGDANKLITASALNERFTNLPTTDTTKLQCANQGDGCTLWTIVDQTAYGAAAGIDLSALVNINGTGACAKKLNGTADYTYNVGCSTPLTHIGDWGVTFPYNDSTVQVNGISACSSLSGTNAASNQAAVQADYVTSGAGATANINPPGENCYCKANDSAAGWVFLNSSGGASYCARDCALSCAGRVRSNSNFRGAVFGAN